MKNTVYSYAGLMERLIDLPALTKPPSPGEKSGAVTCRSRSCRYDEETDTYIKWSVKNEPGAIAYEGIDERPLHTHGGRRPRRDLAVLDRCPRPL